MTNKKLAPLQRRYEDALEALTRPRRVSESFGKEDKAKCRTDIVAYVAALNEFVGHSLNAGTKSQRDKDNNRE